MVPVASVAIICFEMLMGVLVPVALLLYFQKKHHAKIRYFLVGGAVMLLFALVLEQLVHLVVLGGPAGKTIQGNLWLYALYGGLMAGLFEESGRFLALRFVMKKDRDNDGNALMYGAGHGGFEMFYLLVFGLLNTLVYSVVINTGRTEALLAPLDEASRTALLATFDALVQAPSLQFLLSLVERLAAITAQLGLSVLVWFAADRGRKKAWLYPAAIMLHAILDAVAVLAAGSGVPVVAVEGIIWVMAIGIALLAKGVWRKARACAASAAEP